MTKVYCFTDRERSSLLFALKVSREWEESVVRDTEPDECREDQGIQAEYCVMDTADR